MSLDVSALAAYTEQNKFDLITASILGSKVLGMLTPQTGIKTSAAINILSTNATFQAGGCGWSALGATALTQRTLTVGAIAIMEALCINDLEAKYTQVKLGAGSRYESGLPFEQIYSEEKAKLIAKQLEVAIFQGDTASGTANLSKFDGLIKILNALGFGGAGDPIEGNTGNVLVATGITSANIMAIMNAIYQVVPAEDLDAEDLRHFMGWDNFRSLIAAITSSNLFHYNTDEAAKSGEIVLPGTNLRIVATHGLTGTNKMITARLSNLYYGTDLENEKEDFKIWYSEDNNETRFRVDFKAGVQVAFPAETVFFKLN